MGKDMESMFEEKCHAAGLKITPQRLAVYRELVKSKEHPSAMSVWQGVRHVFPNISLDTVNRTLLTLAQIGAAYIVEGSGDVKRFDAHCDDHQHFKCVKCKRIIDLDDGLFGKIDVPRELADKFEILRKTVYIEGYCDQCREKSKR